MNKIYNFFKKVYLLIYFLFLLIYYLSIYSIDFHFVLQISNYLFDIVIVLIQFPTILKTKRIKQYFGLTYLKLSFFSLIDNKTTLNYNILHNLAE